MVEDSAVAPAPTRVGIGWPLLRGLAIAMAVTAWFGALVVAGPLVELWLAPPLRAELNNVTRQNNRLMFAMEGWKERDCSIVSLSTSWMYADGTSMPTTLTRPPDEPGQAPLTGEPPRVLYSAGDHFFRYPFSVNIPSSFVQGSTYLRITATYRCHIFWTLPVVTVIPANGIPPRATASEAG